MRKLNEMKSLRNLRPWVDPDLMLRVEGRFENAELPVDTRHPFIIPCRHALTRLIVLNEHILAGHAGPLYTLMHCIRPFVYVNFRPGLSTTHAVTDVLTLVYDNINEKKYSGLIFLDIQKAFDTVDHNILIAKLEHYGIKGIAKNLFESYLQNRQ